MCGICGFNFPDKILINNMIKILNHRGPDDKGFLIDDKVTLGHTRLSIIDLSQNGRQPIHNEDRSIWIIFNGEIYNYKKLKITLENKGHKFYSNTDTEVIIHAYEEYGYSCLDFFNGQFAFCIYDSVNKILFLARDRYGIKPLYYYLNDANFIFASEIKAIMEYDFDKEINTKALCEYLNYRYTLAPNTIINYIYKLKPQHYLIYDLVKNSYRNIKYYELNLKNFNHSNINVISKILYRLVSNSVKQRMVADVPVCCFLSGGIDSSIITGFASKYNSDINTYSVGFENDSELRYAKIVSDYFNTNHHELIVSNDDLLKNISKMVYYMDEPIGDAAFYPTFMISKLVSKNFKIVLAGEGADEIFGGYDKYKMFYYGRFLSKCSPKVNFHNEIINRFIRYSKLSELEGYLETIRVFKNGEIIPNECDLEDLKKKWIIDGDLYQKMQIFDLKTVLPEDFFMKADKMSSAFGLEERVPYMDFKIVEYSMNFPLKYKINFWNEKFILKRTFNNFLPKVIIKRRKRGYNAPMDIWLKNILGSRFFDLIINNNHGFYKKSEILDLYNKLIRTNDNYRLNFYLAQKCWTIYIFEEWYNQFF